jgi:hypothetical protein
MDKFFVRRSEMMLFQEVFDKQIFRQKFFLNSDYKNTAGPSKHTSLAPQMTAEKESVHTFSPNQRTKSHVLMCTEQKFLWNCFLYFPVPTWIAIVSSRVWTEYESCGEKYR